MKLHQLVHLQAWNDLPWHRGAVDDMLRQIVRHLANRHPHRRRAKDGEQLGDPSIRGTQLESLEIRQGANGFVDGMDHALVVNMGCQ